MMIKMERYIKDGEIKARNRIVVVLDGLQTINPSDEQLARAGWVKYEPPAPTLDEIKAVKVAEIERYDVSDAVNIFYLNGTPMWLDKATRVGLMNSIGIEKAAGRVQTTLWFGGASITLKCDTAISMLSALELYALECYNVTAAHKAAVNALETAEEVAGYDYTVGYPEKPNFSR